MTGATVQRHFDLLRVQKIAENIAAAQKLDQTGLIADFLEQTASTFTSKGPAKFATTEEHPLKTAFTDNGPASFATAREHFLERLGDQRDPSKCFAPGCKLCATEMDKQQKPDTPPLSPKEHVADPSSWQIIESDGKKTVSFAGPEPENVKPELPGLGAYTSPNSSAPITAKEIAEVFGTGESTANGSNTPSSPSSEATPGIPDMASASPFPESPPINNITETAEIYSTVSKHYVYAVRIEHRFDTNIGPLVGFHSELGTLNEVVVRDVFDSLEAANKRVEIVHKQTMKAQGLTEWDTVRASESRHNGDRVFIFLDNPRTFESWSIYTDERVLR